jgi:hypothetical protein
MFELSRELIKHWLPIKAGFRPYIQGGLSRELIKHRIPIKAGFRPYI